MESFLQSWKKKDYIFSKNKHLFNSPPVIFNNKYIERVHEHKHLGVWLSSSLNWDKHVHETCLKANRKLAVLRSVRYLDRSTLDLLYKLTVRSVIDYGLPVYYSTLTAGQLARLSRIQSRAAKLCTGALHWTSQAKLEADLAWQTISAGGEFLSVSLFHKIHTYQTQPLTKTCLPPLNDQNIILRNKRAYQHFKTKTVNFQKSFFPRHALIWDNLDVNLKCEKDLSQFKSKFKELVKPIKQKHFSRGKKRANTLLTQLRVGRSFLNSHRYVFNLAPTDLCICSRQETVKHFLNDCFLYTEERRVLFDSVEQIYPQFKTLSLHKKCDVLLYGINLDSKEPDCRNIPITLAVQKYIMQTKRFM